MNRTHAAAGNLSSGNADTDTLNYATGLANKTYDSYVSNLSPYLSQQTTATQGLANVYTGQGNTLNQSYQGQGQAANQNYTNQGASTAAADMNNYNVSQNLWNGIGKAVNVGSSLFGAFA